MNGLSDKLVNELVESSIHRLVDWRTDGLFWSDSIIQRELSVMLSLAIVRLHYTSHSRKTLPRCRVGASTMCLDFQKPEIWRFVSFVICPMCGISFSKRT